MCIICDRLGDSICAFCIRDEDKIFKWHRYTIAMMMHQTLKITFDDIEAVFFNLLKKGYNLNRMKEVFNEELIKYMGKHGK